MLYKTTVETSTLDLLKSIMEDKRFSDFVLVGGTALSLQIGHRRSIDLDFFSEKGFNIQELADHLRIEYHFELDYMSKNTIKGEIDHVQLDFIAHQYPIIAAHKVTEGIRLASLQEIAAMKLNAITGNGTRIKDFIDLAFLSSYLSLNTMLDVYERKYSSNKILALKSLSYFSEINYTEPIVYLLQNPLAWNTIENRIIEMINNPDTVLPQL